MSLPENLKLEEVKSLLKGIKKYSNLVKSTGKRGKEIFSSSVSGEDFVKVEYSPELELDFVKEKSLEILKNVFGKNIGVENIKFLQKKDLIAGIKVFVNDNMFETSFNKASKLLKV